MKVFLSILAFLVCSFAGFGQTDSTEVDLGIPDYDNFCVIMGGDSVRLQNGRPITGFIKDTYPSGKLKHKGYYENGKITTFTNYYENGNIERNFRLKTDRKGVLEVFYPHGEPLSIVEWNNGESSKWVDYYESGQIEFTEELNKNMEYYLYMRFYFEDGKPQILFELTDEKSRTYTYTEFYPDGKVKESGKKVHNANMGDYQMEGTWQYYDETGKLVLEEDYLKGQLTDDRTY